MGLDLTKLEKVRRRGSNTIARCPACAEAGGDRKGEHLFINNNGQFGCVLYPGQDGQQHRQRIFELTGLPIEQTIRQQKHKYFEIKTPSSILQTEQKVIQKDILGHLGHIQPTHARKNLESHLPVDNTQNDCPDADPSVPKVEAPILNNDIFTTKEQQLLVGIDDESLAKIRVIKELFHGTVVSVKDNKEAVQ